VSKEEWKDVVGYVGLYQASSLGRVKSLKPGRRRYGCILRPARNNRGYLTVALYQDGKQSRVYVHRLVAEAFLGSQPSPDHEVNHKNGDKVDNRVENLEWVTKSENHKHAYGVLGRKPMLPNFCGEQHGMSKFTDGKVVEIRRLYATGNHSYRELGRMFGVSHNNIGRIVRCETWQHVGGPITHKGQLRGEAHGQAKLTRDDVIEIRRLYATGEHTQAELAEMFGVSQRHISNIVRRKHWKHVP